MAVEPNPGISGQRHQLKGCWSRRIDQEHRLVYRVTDEAITVISCRDHY